jgi:hypothetical protein
MQRVTYVYLNRQEQRTVEAALTHIGVAFPAEERDEDDLRLIRALRGVVGGDEVSRRVLLRAREALARLVETAERESDRRHWDRELGEVSDRVKASTGGVPLIAPGADPAAVLAEARQQQSRQAREALSAVEAALRLIPPGEPEPRAERWSA